MISALSNIITNPTLVNIAQNTNGTVVSKTVVNSIGRPGFILIDKNIDNDTKKYAATKEFLYQAACLAVYLGMIVPVFKKGAFKFAKKYVYKGEEGFNKFKSANEYFEYRKYAEKSQTNRKASLSKDHSMFKFEHDGLREELINNDKPELYPHIKGSIEFGSLVGSVIGLAVIAPNVSQALIHPVLKLIGMDENKSKLDKNA